MLMRGLMRTMRAASASQVARSVPMVRAPVPVRAFSVANDAKRPDGEAGKDGEPAADAKNGHTNDAPASGVSLDIDMPSTLDGTQAIEGSGEKGQTNARARRDAPKSQSRVFSSMALIVSVLMGGYGVWMLGRDLDVEEQSMFHESEDVKSFLGRLKLRTNAISENMSKPVWDKLLPDPLPFPYSRPYTLVIDLDQLLVASHWTSAQGWRTAKRPGLDYFLGYLSQWYEIVLFTTQPFYLVEKLVEKLDPHRRYIAYQLFRESARLKDGKLVKDISHLNRDLSKVVILDVEPDHVSLQPENAIILEPWKGNKDDRELIGLIPFLEADVRNALKAYEGKHIPTEHAKREQEIKRMHEEEWRNKKERLGGLSSLFGGVRSGVSMGDKPPKSWIEQERERFQQGYLEDQKFWRENGEALRKQMEEEQERQLREMKMNAWDGMMRIFGGAPSSPADGQGAQGQGQQSQSQQQQPQRA